MSKQPQGFLVERADALLSPGDLMLDLGAGDGSYWADFLARRPEVRYCGIEIFATVKPSVGNQRIVTADCTDAGAVKRALGGSPADLVVSKSALEHIYPERRAALLDTARECLRPGGMFLLLYDQGHFMVGHWQDIKNAIARPLHRLGTPRVQYAQSLDIDRYERVIRSLGFEIRTKRYTGLRDAKHLIGALPADLRPDAERHWTGFEAYANRTFPERVLRSHFTGLIWELERL